MKNRPATAKETSTKSAAERLKEAKPYELAYSLAVKLIATDRKWFNKNTVDKKTKFHDQLKKEEFETIASELKSRIPELSDDKIFKLRPTFTHEPFTSVKTFREVQEQKDDIKPVLLEKIRVMEKRINQINDMIQKRAKILGLPREQEISQQRELYRKKVGNLLGKDEK